MYHFKLNANAKQHQIRTHCLMTASHSSFSFVMLKTVCFGCFELQLRANSSAGALLPQRVGKFHKGGNKMFHFDEHNLFEDLTVFI